MTSHLQHRCVVRAMTESDWPAVQVGFTHSFIDHRTPAVWAWRYQWHLPNQSGWRGWISQAPDGSVAAFVGASVHRCWLQGQEQTLLLAGDHYSHPVWRSRAGTSRQGPFVLTEREFHTACAHEAALAVGIGLDRRVRLGVLSGACTPYKGGHWWRLPLTVVQGKDRGYTIQVLPTNFAELTWDALWAERRQGLLAALVRNQKFLAWRFDDRQGRTYWRFALWSVASAAPVGFIVLTPAEPGRAILVDLMLPEQPQAVRDAWFQVACWLQERGISQVDTLLGCACAAHHWLPMLGFTPIAPPLPVQPIYRCYAPLPNGIDFDRDYAFTLADSDLY